MTDPKERRGLGRGLAALMGDVDSRSAADGPDARVLNARMVSVDRLHPNANQPRRRFPPHALEELATSLRSSGVLQPLIVRPLPGGNQGDYEIVAGERRWRAAQIAELHELPVIVRDLADVEVLQVAIIENIQRADLNILEEAEAYRQLVDRFGHTQEQLAESLGKSRSHIANTLRLLTLPEEVKEYLRDGRLSAGHARALITAADPASLAAKVLADGLTVRDVERLARDKDGPGRSQRKSKREKDQDTCALEQDLTAALGMQVAIDYRTEAGDGHVRIHYRDVEELDRLCQLLSSSR